MSEDDEPLLKSLSSIIEVRSSSETMLDLENNDLKEDFMTLFSFPKMLNEIKNSPNLAEASLQNYLSVLSNYPLESVEQKKVECLLKLIEHYRKWGQTKEMLLAQIQLIRIYKKEKKAD